MEQSKNIDSNIHSFIFKLNELFKEETYDYSFYDFERVEIKEKDEMYNIIQEIKKSENYMKAFCSEINTNLLNYQITHISNITCGQTYKKIRRDIPLQIVNGFYYSFTVICKKNNIKIKN